MEEESANRVEDVHEGKSSRRARAARAIVIIYPLVLASALIAASAFFVAFTVSPGGGPYGRMWTVYPINVRPNQTFTFDIAIVFVEGNHTWSGTFTEGNTSYFQIKPRQAMLNSWDAGKIWAMLQSNQTFDIWVTVYDPQENVIRNITSQANGVSLIDPQNVQTGTYTIEIKNNDGSQEMNATLTTQLELEFFEKPYFYYGIAGLTVGIVGAVVASFYLIKAVLDFLTG